MPTQLLSPGLSQVLTQNTVFALPAVKTTLFCGDNAPVLEVSNTPDFAQKSSITLTAGSASISGAFIRSTGATPITVILKRD